MHRAGDGPVSTPWPPTSPSTATGMVPSSLRGPPGRNPSSPPTPLTTARSNHPAAASNSRFPERCRLVNRSPESNKTTLIVSPSNETTSLQSLSNAPVPERPRSGTGPPAQKPPGGRSLACLCQHTHPQHPFTSTHPLPPQPTPQPPLKPDAPCCGRRWAKSWRTVECQINTALSSS